MSARVFGSTDTLMTGSGKRMRSSRIGEDGSESVSPVSVSFIDTKAQMSPARTSSMSLVELACTSTMRPMRSFLSRVTLYIASPFLITPE